MDNKSYKCFFYYENKPFQLHKFKGNEFASHGEMSNWWNPTKNIRRIPQEFQNWAVFSLYPRLDQGDWMPGISY